MEDRSLPASINYGDVLPQAVPAIQHRRKYYPNNGLSFSPGGNSQIRIELSSPSALLDPKNSYLSFEVANSEALGGATFGFESSPYSFFTRLTLEQGGKVLCRWDELARYCCSVMNPAQTNINGRSFESLTEGSRGYNADGAGVNTAEVVPGALPAGTSPGTAYVNLNHNAVNLIPPIAGAPNAHKKFTVPLLGGLFTQEKMIPLPLLKSGMPLVITLNLEVADRAVIWSAPPVGTGYEIRNVYYAASMVEVGRDVIDQFRMVQQNMGGSLVISSHDMDHNSDTIAVGQTGEQVIRCPSRHKSLKSLFWTAHSENYAGTLGPITAAEASSLTYCGSANVNEYQLKVGAVVYPPTPVRGPGDTALAGYRRRRSECAMELAKAYGSLGWTAPTGYLNTTGYISAMVNGGPNGDGNGDNGAFIGGFPTNLVPQGSQTIIASPFGLDLESFQRTAIESGVDSETLAEAVNLILTIPAASVGIEDKNINIWLLFDQHYYFRSDGTIDFSN